MKKKPLLIVIVLLVVAAGLATRWWLNQEENAAGPLTLYGNVEIRDAQLVFNEQEIVSAIYVDEGDKVVAGQELARLRSNLLASKLSEAQAQSKALQELVRKLENGTRPQEIKQARAAVDAAAIKIAIAEKNLQRLKQTVTVGGTSKQSVDDAQAALDELIAQKKIQDQALELALQGPRTEDIAQAKAQLTAGQAQVAYLQERLADTVLKAPTPGIIQSRILEVGEMAGPSKPAFILALTDPKWIRAYVSEPELGQVKPGMQAEISADSWPDRKFTGQVGFISPAAEFTPQAIETSDLRTKLVYETRILVNDPENELRLGMPVTVTFPQPRTASTTH
ncbi:efflux RND transporter periplasmic adaptor subunit [Pelobacter seleniigenes]|uniref:efflux RND transporter periplasmic adaptor subunit n=1 Tax=Pelobacter seleniigenes TaxID=407188 RepID=UPI0004A6AC44|nr:efflux RND transporter periplasmic adaptor subunit [Pelobacter seleniigenes]